MEKTKIQSYKDLIVWQKSMDLVVAVYDLTSYFPGPEMYGLTSQMRRCSISVPSNISEGFNRFHNKEYKQFLYVALGSCAELETQTEIAAELKYLDEKEKIFLLEKLDHESRMLGNLIKKLN